MPLCTPAYDHPGWAGADPTATYDAYWFQVQPMEAYVSFGFDYSGEIFKLRHRRRGEIVEVEVFVPAGVDQDGPHLSDDLDLEPERWCLSVWLGGRERSMTSFAASQRINSQVQAHFLLAHLFTFANRS